MSGPYNEIIASLAAIETNLDRKNKIIEDQREQLEATRKQLGHAQERVASLEYELAYRDTELLAREKSEGARWVLGVWLRALGGKSVSKSHLIDGLAITTRRLRGIDR